MTTTTPDGIRQRDEITPEIFSRLDHIRQTAFRHAHMLARSGLQVQRKELERVMTAVDEIRELVQALDQLPFELAEEKRQAQEAEDMQIQRDRAKIEAEAVNDG